MADLSGRIEQAAGAPASVSTDGLSVSEPNIKDLMAADRYLAQKAAAGGPLSGMRVVKLINRTAYGTTVRGYGGYYGPYW